jgi:hypothetical protein
MEENSHNEVHLPAPTAAPMLFALGITLGFAGLVTSVTVGAVGIVIAIVGAVSWFSEVLPAEHEEPVTVVPESIVVVQAKLPVAYLGVGEKLNRAVLPLEIYPYSAGIKGGIAGGVVMALLAAAQGILIHHSPWYTINILAATAMPSLAQASTATLSGFMLEPFVIAVVIHATASLLVGLLYGVMLPMFPRYPAFWAAIVAPLLWTGLLWATLDVINPVLDQRIEWRSFILCQIAFGAVAGYVVDRTEKVRTLQHLPFAVRTGIEARFESDDDQKGGA